MPKENQTSGSTRLPLRDMQPEQTGYMWRRLTQPVPALLQRFAQDSELTPVPKIQKNKPIQVSSIAISQMVRTEGQMQLSMCFGINLKVQAIIGWFVRPERSELKRNRSGPIPRQEHVRYDT